MSYLDIAQGGEGSRELGSMRPPGPNQPSEVDKINQHLIQQVFRLRTAVSRLKADVAKLGGGAADTVDLRKSVSTATSKIQDDAKNIKEELLRLGGDQKNRQTTKILNDFEVTLKDFQTTLKVAKGKEAASLPKQRKAVSPFEQRGDVESGGGDSEKQALLQEQKRKDDFVLVNEMTYNESLIDERDHGIAEIQQQIGEVNEIFQDLAVLVNDQGMQLDDIESNITRTAERTLEGNRELIQAERSQRSARNRTCWILMVVAVVMVVLVLVLSL